MLTIPFNERLEGDANGEALFADADGLQNSRVPQLAADYIRLKKSWLLVEEERRRALDRIVNELTGSGFIS